ncbi:MAG: LysR family transcriptional regulator [Clostridium sp.]|nr:LysR family transcriptional regulator [Clostridium sp.]MCM1398348.1 LysR family transcriptional regulator [Clostridium sp.]MCM1458987.1 LysR family transcriptional regulator [Bacteroides sp.]
MELRVLQYFLAVVREQSVSGAAEYLHLSQPTLSRQLKDLEEELGKQLFIRGNRKITLTNEGMTLRKRAEEIMQLVKKTEDEITLSDDTVSGNIYIGAGETDTIRMLARAAKQLQQEYPNIRLHISSGDSTDVQEQLNKGLLDFGVLFEPTDLSEYNYLQIPAADEWGVLMRRDMPLSEKDVITPKDLYDKPLIISRQAVKKGQGIFEWLNKDPEELDIVATYSLLFNGSLMVDEGMGYALCLNRIINTTGNSSLCFKPLSPKLNSRLNVVWKKYQLLDKASELFLAKLQTLFSAK